MQSAMAPLNDTASSSVQRGENIHRPFYPLEAPIAIRASVRQTSWGSQMLQIRNVTLINGRGKVVRCVVGNTAIDVFPSKPAAVCAVVLLEEVDRLLRVSTTVHARVLHRHCRIYLLRRSEATKSPRRQRARPSVPSRRTMK